MVLFFGFLLVKFKADVYYYFVFLLVISFGTKSSDASERPCPILGDPGAVSWGERKYMGQRNEASYVYK